MEIMETTESVPQDMHYFYVEQQCHGDRLNNREWLVLLLNLNTKVSGQQPEK
jgi:hypothetical protein